jgi:hypothetical protein
VLPRRADDTSSKFVLKTEFHGVTSGYQFAGVMIPSNGNGIVWDPATPICNLTGREAWMGVSCASSVSGSSTVYTVTDLDVSCHMLLRASQLQSQPIVTCLALSYRGRLVCRAGAPPPAVWGEALLWRPSSSVGQH